MFKSAMADSENIRVDLGARAYDVLVGRGLLAQTGALLKERGLHGPVAVVADAAVAKTLGAGVLKSLESARYDSFLIEVPGGEASKSMERVAELLSALARRKVPRSGTVLALGGGVIGDLAGFVAATYLRGVALVHAPTTLLAMVDSSVGGKTGVNLAEGKNLVGSFHQPRLALADLDALATLPTREFSAGMAEVIKYGAIADAKLFERVARGVQPGDADLASIISRCVAIKARIVERDEFETTGERALLNFGHTLGHAIEKATGYRRYLHGEAIAIGMRAAGWLSRELEGLPAEEFKHLVYALAKNKLPIELDEAVPGEAILAALGNDKKVASDGENRWILLKKLGEARSGIVVPPDKVAAVCGASPEMKMLKAQLGSIGILHNPSS
jgi:3-dehydroquinate synthase